MLYHGTDSVSAQKIMKEGFSARSCLTSDEKLAWYFAEARIEELDDNNTLTDDIDQVVLTVTLDEAQLVVDYPAYEEPISIYRNEFVGNDRDWHELCGNGDIPYPTHEDDVDAALEATTCVRVKNLVLGTLFSIID